MRYATFKMSCIWGMYAAVCPKSNLFMQGWLINSHKYGHYTFKLYPLPLNDIGSHIMTSDYTPASWIQISSSNIKHTLAIKEIPIWAAYQHHNSQKAVIRHCDYWVKSNDDQQVHKWLNFSSSQLEVPHLRNSNNKMLNVLWTEYLFVFYSF